MVFSSITFLLYFLPVFIIIYSALPKAMRNWFILFASILFYSWGAPTFVFILLGSTILDYFVVQAIHRAEQNSTRRKYLIASLVLNLGLLAYFKYANFFIENVNNALGSLGFEQVAWTSVALPIGISFYTFQTLTYSIDVYRRVHAPLKHLHNYLLYIMSFPQMIAGPIVRFNEIAGQITGRRHHIDDRIFGFYRFSIGLGKKVLIANVLGDFAQQMIDTEVSSLSSWAAWLGMLAYTFQIYFDFAGYSDMAIGLGRIMGFHFPENFDNPYTSKSITEFWRRWHITLGTWMKNYLYIPLGGNRVSSRGRLYFNLWFVFLVSRLWHGASWNFVIWGAYHGLFLILDRLFLESLLNKLGTVLSVVITFFITVVGWTLFSIEDITHASAYIERMFSFVDGMDITLSNELVLTGILAILISFFTLSPFGKKLQAWVYSDGDLGTLRTLRLLSISALLFTLCVAYITASGFNPFIYFRF